MFNKLLKKVVGSKNFLPVIFVFLVTFFVYVKNLSPSVHGGDSGDLAAAVITKGVSHPSGYPLFTMLGIIANSLPLGHTIAWRIGLVSALSASAAVVLIYFTIFELTKSRYLSVITSLTAAFTYTFWLYAQHVEVIALNGFFVALLTYLTLKYLSKKDEKVLLFLAFSAGAALTNNQSILILLAVVGPTLIIANPKLLLAGKVIIKGLLFFALGLLPYVYIPIVARTNPEINWGFALTWANLVALITRQYYGWGTGRLTQRLEADVTQNRLTMYSDYWAHYIHVLVLPLILGGVVYLIIKKKFLPLFFLSLSFLLTTPAFILYAGRYFTSFLGIASLEKFLTTGFILSSLFLPFGVLLVTELTQKLPIRSFIKKVIKVAIFLVFALIPIVSFVINFNRVSLRGVTIGEDLAKDILASATTGSSLLLRNDSLSFNSIFYQIAYGGRRGVTIPGPTNGFEVSLRALGKSEAEITELKITNKGVIDKDMFEKSIPPLMTRGDVYFDGPYTLNIDQEEIVAIPMGLLYKLEFKKNLPYPKEDYLKRVGEITSTYHTQRLKQMDDLLLSNFIIADVKKMYSTGFYNIADYLRLQYGYDDNVLKYLIKSIEIDPLVYSEKEVEI